MHTVKRAAELTGISPDTLRAWERRYRVVEPRRTESGYRLYDDQALRRLATMKALVDSGWGTAQAAQRALESPGLVTGAANADVAPGPRREDAKVVADLDALVRAARDLDGPRLVKALDAGFASGSFESVLDEWLFPSLARLGEAWVAGEIGIAAEHFVSAAVQRRLSAFYDAAGGGISADPAVVVGLAAGSRHEIGVLAFAVSLQRLSVPTTYVGADMPLESWVDLVMVERPVGVVLGVPTAEDVPAVRALVAALSALEDAPRIFVGGAHQDQVGGASLALGHAIGDGAAAVARALAPVG